MTIVFDEQCVSCSATAHPGVPLRFRIVLRDWPRRGSYGPGWGLAAIEFRLNGVPEEWTKSFEPTALASFASDPFARADAVVQFDPPLSVVPDCLVLYECTVTPTSVPAIRISINEPRGRSCPEDPRTPAGPRTYECSTQGLGVLCISSCCCHGEAYLDGRPCATTAIAASPWSGIKRIYR
jgi:hypothetical protein